MSNKLRFITIVLSFVLCLSVITVAFGEDSTSPLAAATTVKQVVNEKFINENDTDSRLYYDSASGIANTDILNTEGRQYGSYADYSFTVKDAEHNPKEPTGVVYIVFPFPSTFYTMDSYKVYYLNDDETTVPAEANKDYFINGTYVYIKTTKTGSFRLVDEDYQAPFRCDFCTQFEQVTNDANANTFYKYLITIIHFFVHNVTALVRPR